MQIVEDDFPHVREVDMKLIELAKVYDCKIVTNDFNLNKVAQLHGVEVLNINELANSLKPIVLPGETMRVFILKEGKEYNQGVAYLDDGTMVVVDNAKRMISKTIDISVTSVLQTTAGKMIFGKFDDRMHAVVAEKHERPRAAQGGSGRRRLDGSLERQRQADRKRDNERYESCSHPARGGSRHPHAERTSAETTGTSRKQFMLLDGVAHPAAHGAQVRGFASRERDRGRAARARISNGSTTCCARKIRNKPVARGRGRQQPAGVGREAPSPPSIPDTDLVAVHDAVRPFVDLETIEKVIDEAAEYGAAIVGIVPVDTVKQVSGAQAVGRQRSARPSRASAWCWRRPRRCFATIVLKRAFEAARRDGFVGTDESSLVERLEQVEVQRGAGQRPQHQDHQARRHGSRAAVPRTGNARSRLERVPNRAGLGRPPHRRRPSADSGRRHHSLRIRPRRPFRRRRSGARHHRRDSGRRRAGRHRHALSRYRPALERRRQPAVSAARRAIWRASAGFEFVNVDSTVILERPKLKDYRTGHSRDPGRDARPRRSTASR